MSKLKDLRVILGVILFISWVIGLGGVFLLKSNYDKIVAQKDAEIVALNSTLEQIGELVPAYKVRSDVTSGKEIEESDLESINLPVVISENLVTNIEDIKNMHYKIGLTSGTPLFKDNLYEEELTDDLRLFDVVTHSNPVGLEVGSFVDIRISLPMGEDYIALAHKQVKGINSGVLKLAINENDIHTYNSMLVDSILYPGTQIYAVEYIEGGVQKPADVYYPMSKNVITIAEKDPNLLNAIKEDIVKRRDMLETGLTSAGVGIEDDDRQRELENGRSKLIQQLSKSQEELDKQKAELAKEQERLQKQQNQENSDSVILGG